MPEIIIRASARREIKAHGIYLEEHAGPQVADRFLAAVKDTLDVLATIPSMGLYADSGEQLRAGCGAGPYRASKTG